MDILEKFSLRKIWGMKLENCNLEVVRWEHKIPKDMEYLLSGGKYIWNIYCYIFPGHSLFNQSEKEEIFDCPIEFHGGCTYVRWNRNFENEITCKCYGNDYNHYGDEYLSNIQNIEDNYKLLNDVDDLINKLGGK